MRPDPAKSIIIYYIRLHGLSIHFMRAGSSVPGEYTHAHIHLLIMRLLVVDKQFRIFFLPLFQVLFSIATNEYVIEYVLSMKYARWHC